MIQALLFIRNDDPSVGRIKQDLQAIQQDYPHRLNIIDIDQEPILKEEYGDKAPVLDIGVYRLLMPFDLEEMRFAFGKANKRLQEAQTKGNAVMVRRITEPLEMTKSDRFSRWFSNHYMIILNVFSFAYVFFALLAPTLMYAGWEPPAKAIYSAFRPLCHQLAFRSFFIFGEQPYYPRALAGVEGVMTYAEASGFSEFDLVTARDFLGNETMGYKMAACERDVAIYGSMFLFGIVFSLTGNKIKPLPWYLFILIGLVPIGLDGFSQLLSQTGLPFLAWIPLRESTPFLRVFTGAGFGLGTAWFGFPYLEESVLENRREMKLKHAITQQIQQERELS